MKLTLSILTLQFTAVILFAQSPSPSTTGLQTDLSGSRLHLVSLANARFDESDLSKTAFRSVNLTVSPFSFPYQFFAGNLTFFVFSLPVFFFHFFILQFFRVFFYKFLQRNPGRKKKKMIKNKKNHNQ